MTEPTKVVPDCKSQPPGLPAINITTECAQQRVESGKYFYVPLIFWILYLIFMTSIFYFVPRPIFYKIKNCIHNSIIINYTTNGHIT